MLIVGTILIIISGCGIPLFIYLLSLVFDEFTYYSLAVSETNSSFNINNQSYFCSNSNMMLRKYILSNDSDSLLQEEVAKLSYYTVILSTVYLFTSIVAKVLWNYSALRQTNSLRINFIQSLLAKDIAWYDLNPSTELHTYLNE